MLNINGKTFMNIQEAVQWLLDNNCIPFQCTANYLANTEIGLGTIVNPSPAKVRIGSLIFFADSKVSTVTGMTENGFICSDKYNNLVDDIAYVTNIAINGSGHLITTLSDGQTIDAGLIKQITSLTINASQHFIVNYNDGTSSDLGSLGDYSNVDFVAKTLKQTNANYSSGVSPNIGLGLTVTGIYSRVEEINNVLYLVFNYSITNNTGSPQTAYSLGTIYINLTSEIAEKVIDLNGHSARIADSGNCLIAPFKGFCLNSNKVPSHEINCEVKNANIVDQIVIEPSYSDGITWAVGATKYLTGRTFLTLL